MQNGRTSYRLSHYTYWPKRWYQLIASRMIGMLVQTKRMWFLYSGCSPFQCSSKSYTEGQISSIQCLKKVKPFAVGASFNYFGYSPYYIFFQYKIQIRFSSAFRIFQPLNLDIWYFCWLLAIVCRYLRYLRSSCHLLRPSHQPTFEYLGWIFIVICILLRYALSTS